MIDPNPKANEAELKTNEQRSTRRSTTTQDVRYATEPDEQNRIIEKYEKYQVSKTNACHVRFLLDHREKEILFGQKPTEEEENLQKIGKKFDLKISAGFQRAPKFSYKLFGTEFNVQRCLIDSIEQIFKGEKKETKFSEPTAVFVTTINPDASITEEEKSIPKSNESNDEKQKSNSTENSTEFKFTFLISPQGNEVLKKNWNFFGEFLQKRLKVSVSNPSRSTKFGDKQILYELFLTSFSVESIVDAALRITNFINEILGVPTQIFKANDDRIENQKEENSRRKTNNSNVRQVSTTNHGERTFFNRNRGEIFEEKIFLRNDCVGRIVGKRGSNLKLIKNKCHLRDLTIEREANENLYNECFVSAFQMRNVQFAIETIRSFLHNEDSSAVLVPSEQEKQTKVLQNETKLNSTESNFSQSTLTFPSTNKESAFSTKSFQLNTTNNFPQPSYNFQNRPSFDFTHQATSASRKTDKRPGDLVENSPYLQTPNDSEDPRQVHSSSSTSSSISPRHRSKRTCPETKEIHCTTEDGFWIQKQYYHALDDASKQTFDDLLEKLEKIRIANEENAVKKQQRLAGRNRTTKIRILPSTVVVPNEENNAPLKPIDKENEQFKPEISIEVKEEKEIHQDSPKILIEKN